MKLKTKDDRIAVIINDMLDEYCETFNVPFTETIEIANQLLILAKTHKQEIQ